ncbi:hypothetical protein RUM43_013053 [Polyplax serrata]|uniref:E3 ubiquitin-protein ligase n=1 Tax=Polyplax serrata TaxID=468196 RepID=A0AAN8NQS3_POLSC
MGLLERSVAVSYRKMSAEMMDTAEETIIDFITCPYCNDYVQPPSLCCENGHFVCHGCKLKVRKCPSCGTENYPNKNNTIFDMILREIYYPCFYQEDGCSAYFKYDELKLHQLTCNFKMEPCMFNSDGCKQLCRPDDREAHESRCEYGVSCRVYTEIKGVVYTQCNWRGTRKDLPLHVTMSHQFAWCPYQIESNVALSWMLPMNFNFEKVELIHLKDIDEMFYFYSKSIGNSQHFIAVQHIGKWDDSKEFIYSVEFIHEDKKVGFEDLVIPYTVGGEDIYRSRNCFSIHYEFLKKHFLAESVIDCYVKVLKKGQKNEAVKRYLTYLDNVIKED